MNKKNRPVLENLVNSQTTDIERFQNKVIRPIIKMQHELVITLFKDYLLKKKINFNSFAKEKKILKIQSILKTDSKFKTLLLGCILGHFSIEELKTYISKPSEFNKRVSQIITQRLIDSLYEI
mgnify:CR=1 FL=1